MGTAALRDCRFGKSNTVHVVQSNDEYPFAFSQQTGLYDWPVVLGASGSFTSGSDSPDTPASCRKASSIHRAHSTAHVHHLGATDAAAAMHRRLHAGASRLRSLPKLCSDAPKSLAHVSEVSCPACTEANATHLSHKCSRYKPSYPGSLIHGDTVGPFQRSSRGHHYALILVDDHSVSSSSSPSPARATLRQ
jgi:hypothetical protein